jgi:hypothetical protein
MDDDEPPLKNHPIELLIGRTHLCPEKAPNPIFSVITICGNSEMHSIGGFGE